MSSSKHRTHSAQAIYLSVADELAEQISGKPTGFRLPSETELARDLGVGRLTVRAALAELERRYVIRRKQGSGTFVSHRIPYPIGRHQPPSWSQSIRQAGFEPEVRTRDWRLLAPPPEVRQAFGPDDAAVALLISRDRYINGELVGFAESYFNTTVVPDLPQRLPTEGSIFTTLECEYGLNPVRGWFGVALDPAPADVAQHLELTGRPPIIAIRSRTDAAALENRTIEFTTSWLRADIFRIEVELGE